MDGKEGMMKKKKGSMRLKGIISDTNTTFRTSKPRGITISAPGSQTYLPKKSKAKILIDPKKYSGLCLCCSYSSVCTYPRDPDKPVLQCEEFDGISMSKIGKETTYGHDVSRSPLPLQVSTHLAGLCANCENLNVCTYPKPEGGVWHCEEYC